MIKYNIFAKEFGYTGFGRIVGFREKAIWVYEGQIVDKKPEGYGRLIFTEENEIFCYFGEFQEGVPHGKIIKFFINPTEKKL